MVGREAKNPRFQKLSRGVRITFISNGQRSWSYNGHLTSQDIEYLPKFIKVEFFHEFSNVTQVVRVTVEMVEGRNFFIF